jgi:cold shock protein
VPLQRARGDANAFFVLRLDLNDRLQLEAEAFRLAASGSIGGAKLGLADTSRQRDRNQGFMYLHHRPARATSRYRFWPDVQAVCPKKLGARLRHLQKSTNGDHHAIGVGEPYLHKRKTYTMQAGTVKFYNDQKGFGFIQPDDGGKDVFVHATALERAGIRGLREGQKVTFDTQEDRRTGKIAVGNITAS